MFVCVIASCHPITFVITTCRMIQRKDLYLISCPFECAHSQWTYCDIPDVGHKKDFTEKKSGQQFVSLTSLIWIDLVNLHLRIRLFLILKRQVANITCVTGKAVKRVSSCTRKWIKVRFPFVGSLHYIHCLFCRGTAAVTLDYGVCSAY